MSAFDHVTSDCVKFYGVAVIAMDVALFIGHYEWGARNRAVTSRYRKLALTRLAAYASPANLVCLLIYMFYRHAKTAFTASRAPLPNQICPNESRVFV